MEKKYPYYVRTRQTATTRTGRTTYAAQTTMTHPEILDAGGCRRFFRIDLANTYAVLLPITDELGSDSLGPDFSSCRWAPLYGSQGKTEVSADPSISLSVLEGLPQFMLGNLYYCEDEADQIDTLLDRAARERVAAVREFLMRRDEEFKRRKAELRNRYDD